jgi:hypothetical protein
MTGVFPTNSGSTFEPPLSFLQDQVLLTFLWAA